MAPFNDDKSIQKISDLCRAEILIPQYKPNEAKIILDQLASEIDEETEPEYFARILEGFGNTIINACTIIGADIFKAVEHFKQSYSVYERIRKLSRIPVCLMELGKAYVYIGRHVDAEKSFEEALQTSSERNNFKLSAKILDEMGKMYRLEQNVEKSLIPLEKSLEIRKKHKDDKNMGVYYYYLANTYRDLDRFDEAEKYYDTAEQYLVDIDDKFRLCELYCDKSWLKCLSENYKDAEILVERSWALAQKYEFGTEFSEYYHIKYEIAIANGNYELAYTNLDEALLYAKKYSNIYIILDCLNHCAQRAYAEKKTDAIPKIIDEMNQYDNLGCGIRVFTGRATMILGDVYYDDMNYSSAYDYWKDGLKTIALYGNSRSNMELFSDILNDRSTKIKDTLTELGVESKLSLIEYWKSYGLENHFPELLELCK